MNIQYVNPGFEAMLDSIMLFQNDDEAAFWSDSIFYFYPTLDKARLQHLDRDGKRRYLAQTLKAVYDDQIALMDQKVIAYGQHWAACRPQVEDAFSDAFGMDCRPLFNDVRAEISMNPVCPRFLDTRTFQVFYLNSEHGAVGVSLHELVHFVWFDVWQRMFHDNQGEYERPHLKWILSEMVVECILSDERLSSINPYFPRERGGCVYSYFQDMRLGGESALDALAERYRQMDMPTFMRESLAYCQRGESEIRAHIAEAEKQL